MIYLGADHAGFQLKEEIKKLLTELGHEYEDLSKKEVDPQDDYPDFALAVAKKVIANKGRGILICATGVGMSIAANKVKGIRAALCHSDFIAMATREHNDTNVLCIGSSVIDVETAKKIVRIWLETEFTGEQRHVKRLEKIKKIEEEAK